MKKLLSIVSLFSSISTLLCCALPALFVALGMGAAMAGLVTNFPQLIWLSQHKIALFLIAGLLLTVAGWAQWQAKNQVCPPDKELAAACADTRAWSVWVYYIACGIYLIGGFFAFLAPLVF